MGLLDGFTTDLAHMAMEWKTAVTCKGPNQTRGCSQGSDGTADGHDQKDDDHTRRTSLGAHGVVKDLHVWIAEDCGGACEHFINVDGNEEDGDYDCPAEGTVEESGHKH